METPTGNLREMSMDLSPEVAMGDSNEEQLLLSSCSLSSNSGSVDLTGNGVAMSSSSPDVEGTIQEHKSSTDWKDLTNQQRAMTVIKLLLKFTFLLTALYFFICSLGMLSDSFQLVGGREAGDALSENKVIANPLGGLMIGVLATVLLQSSSTTTSLVVALTASKVIPSVKSSIPIIMGANIGTSVTNTIVSLGQVADREQFERAFAGATVHDMFNFLAVLILLPLEAASGYLYYLTKAIVDKMSLAEGAENQEFLSVLTDPFIGLFVQLNRTAIIENAKGNATKPDTLLKVSCGTLDTVDCAAQNVTLPNCTLPCHYAFFGSSLSDRAIGIIMLAVALVMLIGALLAMVKALRSVLGAQMEGVVRKAANGTLPGKAKHFTPYVAMLIGAGVTMLVQSSSVFTSTLTPLVGIGLLSLERMFPLTLGSNIGTTFTGILAALAVKGAAEDRRQGFQVAFAHLFFNLSAVLIWFPVPFMRNIVLSCAKFMGSTTAKYRWFAILYLVLAFLLIPGLVFALSLGGLGVMLGVLVPLFVLLILIWLLNMLQRHRVEYLPSRLKTWEFLPIWLRSLQPYDDLVARGIKALRRNVRRGKSGSYEVAESQPAHDV